MDKFNSGLPLVLRRLGKFAPPLDFLEKESASEIIEIRFSVKRPAQLIFRDKVLFIGKSGRRIYSPKSEDCFDSEDLKYIFSSVCEHSVHTYEREICGGFLTVEGGSRAGICGTAIYENGKVSSVKDISSIAIRISHEVLGAADRLTEIIKRDGLEGILVAGPPCSGKTTVLRDFARALASGCCGKFYRTAIIDERMEIAGIYRGVPSFDIGITSDVLNGYLKSDGMITAVRALSPDILICDEFGGDEDVSASLFAMKCGVKVAASAHAESLLEIAEKPVLKKLIEEKVFGHIVFLDKPGEIKEIIEAKDVLA